MSWLVTNFIATFLLPPLNLLLLMALSLFLLYRRHKLAKPLLFAAFGLLWLISMPYFAEGALHLLEVRTAALNSQRPNGHGKYAALDDKTRHARSPLPNPLPQAGEGAIESLREFHVNGQPQTADAIVILGGGTYFHAPEYAGQDTIGEATLVRLRYGAKLQRETGKPVLVTGGKPLGNSVSEAQQMRSSLEQDFQVPVRWIEDASDNTFENARYSFRTLQKTGIKKIYLVTHAWHMPRAADVFRRAGFEVVEAPTAFTTRYQTDLFAFLPNAGALRDSKIFIHEIIGSLWYRVKLAISGI